MTTLNQPITPLRQHLIDDMTLRKLEVADIFRACGPCLAPRHEGTSQPRPD